MVYVVADREQKREVHDSKLTNALTDNRREQYEYVSRYSYIQMLLLA